MFFLQNGYVIPNYQKHKISIKCWVVWPNLTINWNRYKMLIWRGHFYIYIYKTVYNTSWGQHFMEVMFKGMVKPLIFNVFLGLQGSSPESAMKWHYQPPLLQNATSKISADTYWNTLLGPDPVLTALKPARLKNSSNRLIDAGNFGSWYWWISIRWVFRRFSNLLRSPWILM